MLFDFCNQLTGHVTGSDHDHATNFARTVPRTQENPGAVSNEDEPCEKKDAKITQC
jgi:hypothetical protein